MALKFIAKGRVGGSTTPTEDVVISTRGKKSYTISFNEDSLKTINSTLQLPVALMVAVTDSRIYFVPSNKKSNMAFAVSSKDTSRPAIRIGKGVIDISKFDGVYNFHFDDKEGAYYIDRKFLLR